MFPRLHRRAPLAVALSSALLVSSCASDRPEPATSGKQAVEGRYASQTLADLEAVDIEVELGSIDEEASIEGALESYKQAVQLFNDPEKRVESLRRMADLAMAASTEQATGDGPSLEEAPVVPSRLSEEDEVRLDQNIDAMLFQSFMQGAQDAKSQEEMYQMLDLAGGLAPELQGTDLAANYETAITLYQSVIRNSKDPKERAEAYYLMAKAYDIAGKHEESVATLRTLAAEFPNSTFYLEAQFRLGEGYFSDGEFDLAHAAYSEVVKAGDVTAFYEQSLYKRGWSAYKVSDYEKALVDFFGLIDHLDKAAAAAPGEPDLNSKLLDDTFRVASMSFNNLDGAKSVTEWFATRGHRPYEHKIYRALAEVYVKQERYLDAADAYESYVTLYPENDLAPEFSSGAIAALQQGGFPSLVLPAKEKFVTRYGMAGKFWQAHPGQREAYLPLLKSHLLDLARHYHAQAQKSGQPADYLVAAGWYAQLIKTDPKDAQVATVTHLYAETLFAGREFLAAIREFERTAYDFPGYERAGEAAYFSLVAYQAQADDMEARKVAEAEYNAFLAGKINASLRFAKAFPGHEKTPLVLQNVTEDQLARKDIKAAVSTAGMLVSLNPPPSTELQKYGWTTIANGEFDLQRYNVAEFAYGKVLAFEDLKPDERKTYKERLAASIYKQGELLVAAGKDIEGAQQFMRVGTVVADAGVRATAEFDAATIFLKKEQWALAIPVLESFRGSYPDNELQETVPDKLALAYEKTGNWAGAAREMETIHTRSLKTDPALAAQALWQAAEYTGKAGNQDGEIRLYNLYVTENPQPLAGRMEAQYKLAQLHEKRGETALRDRQLLALSAGAKAADGEATPRTNFLGAYATFTLAEPVFQRFVDYKLKLPLKASLAEKRKLMQVALDAYATTARLGVAEYTSAAQFRTAEIYRVLAADLMASEKPRGLDELDLEQYTLLLEEQALPFEDQAIDLYLLNANLVTQDIYDEWVKKSIAALAILQPGRYAKKEQAEDHVDILY